MNSNKKSNPEFENSEKIILRDYLALERTRLANERTLFSYIRTSLYLLLGGIAIQHVEEFKNIKWAGYIILFISAVILFIGIVKYFQLKAKLKKYYSAINS